jgi:hypothetical protein
MCLIYKPYVANQIQIGCGCFILLTDTTSRIRLSSWRMKTTADASIHVNQLMEKFEMLHLYTHLFKKYATIRIVHNYIVVSCRWAFKSVQT